MRALRLSFCKSISMAKNNKRRSRFGFLIILSTLVCIVGAVVIYAVSIPIAAEDLGPASETLDPLDRLYLAAYLLANERKLHEPLGDPLFVTDFDVFGGESAAEVVARLIAIGLLDDGELLLSYLEYRGLDVGIQIGTHQLTGEMTIVTLAEALQSAVSPEVPFTVVAGWRMEQISDLLPTSGLSFDVHAFLDAAHARPVGYSFAGEIPEPPNLEGFLFPDTYTLDREISAVDFVVTMLSNFDANVNEAMRAGFRAQGLSIYQAVTLASIIEREAVVDDELQLMASVFLNRLALGMKLDADPTIQYALGLQADGSWWKSPLSLTDLSFDSPYNTYLYPGLPPTPICNPGIEALQAVAEPAVTGYLYFRALCDGSGRHAFATTFEEHQSNACP
jgi:UPF0755 protein